VNFNNYKLYQNSHNSQEFVQGFDKRNQEISRKQKEAADLAASLLKFLVN